MTAPLTAAPTPGPWNYHKLPDGRYLIFNEDMNIAGTAHEGFGPNDESIEEANARLIAAAPDLLEALENMTHGLPELLESIGYTDEENMITQARAANAKARKP